MHVRVIRYGKFILLYLALTLTREVISFDSLTTTPFDFEPLQGSKLATKRGVQTRKF